MYVHIELLRVEIPHTQPTQTHTHAHTHTFTMLCTVLRHSRSPANGAHINERTPRPSPHLYSRLHQPLTPSSSPPADAPVTHLLLPTSFCHPFGGTFSPSLHLGRVRAMIIPQRQAARESSYGNGVFASEHNTILVRIYGSHVVFTTKMSSGLSVCPSREYLPGIFVGICMCVSMGECAWRLRISNARAHAREMTNPIAEFICRQHHTYVGSANV